jgi:hypothetical protein
MQFWPVNEMAAFAFGMPAPHFEDIFVSATTRAGSRFKEFLCFISTDVRFYWHTPKMCSCTSGGRPLH